MSSTILLEKPFAFSALLGHGVFLAISVSQSMQISVKSKRGKVSNEVNILTLDVTSKGSLPWVKFSPFYPHKNIPVPFSPEYFGASVEGIWQGLKVFELADIDLGKFSITTMKNIKRTSKRYGKVLGHRSGVQGRTLLSYREARYQIYLPTYRWILENCLQEELIELKELCENQHVVLLDYEANANVEDLSKPLSHAWLIVQYISNNWPARSSFTDAIP
jgi:hypothetical protein